MTPEQQQFLNEALLGRFDDLEALLQKGAEVGPFSDEAVVALAQSIHVPARMAAIEYGRGRTESAVLRALEHLADDSEEPVRHQLAVAIREERYWWQNGRSVQTLLHDSSARVRRQAAHPAVRWNYLFTPLCEMLLGDDEWTVRQEIARSFTAAPSIEFGCALLEAVAGDTDEDVRRSAIEALERLADAKDGFPATMRLPRVPILRSAQERVSKLPKHRAPKLQAWLDEKNKVSVDIDQLREFGTLLSDPPQLARIDRAFRVDEAVAGVLRILQGGPPRAALVVGESGTGKTAVIQEVVHRLSQIPGETWHVLRISPSEFLTGTKYLGEWETKLRELTKAIRAPRKVILYIPNLEELAWIGRSSASQANVATALAPHIERGEIMIVGESTEESFRHGLGADPSLRRLFQMVKLKPTKPEETRSLLREVAQTFGTPLDDSFLDRLLELADFYRTDSAQPGRAIELLRRVLGEIDDPNRVITEDDILAAIRRSTGIPTHLLDDQVPLDRIELRRFFESRVMGQPEAVDAAVDLVTLVKAGLTDPHKPLGVMLFVGPTGVGKTELARTLAELCFGDAARLHRLDMSEYATYEAFERLIGQHGRPGNLTSVVKEQPFSILLLDEIEKAHMNVFDLCLQIFDAGRLTDSQGRTADFRRSIIILTSNIGSAISDGSPIGFNPSGRKHSVEANATKELSRVFRPEFLNRLDRIVHFRPLSEETAAKIAHREVDLVLERSGIRRRRLFVDIDASVYPLLLREGYSKAYGARPLKRTVERLVLLPLARRIAEGHIPPGSLARLVVRGARVQVDLTPAEEPDSAPAEASPPPASPGSLRERVTEFVAQVGKLREQASPLSAQKSALVARTAAAGFWENPSEAHKIGAQIHRCDVVLDRLEQLWKSTHTLEEQAARIGQNHRELAKLEDRLEELEARSAFAAGVMQCREPDLLGDAVVTITCLATQGKPLQGVERLAKMYQKLAHRYRFEVEVLDDQPQQGSPGDTVSLLIGGVGAYLLLAQEAGLHQISRRRGGGKDSRSIERDVIRVDVGLVPPGDLPLKRQDLRTEIRAIRDLPPRLLKSPKYEVQVLHMPSMVSLRVLTDGEEETLLDRLLPLMWSKVSAVQKPHGDTPVETPVVRRYRLGNAPLVKDVRTGRKTGRADDVFSGRLDQFLRPLEVGP